MTPCVRSTFARKSSSSMAAAVRGALAIASLILIRGIFTGGLSHRLVPVAGNTTSYGVGTAAAENGLSRASLSVMLPPGRPGKRDIRATKGGGANAPPLQVRSCSRSRVSSKPRTVARQETLGSPRKSRTG